jgi:hypothetical protein
VALGQLQGADLSARSVAGKLDRQPARDPRELLALQLISAVFRAELELSEDSELPLNKMVTVTVGSY